MLRPTAIIVLLLLATVEIQAQDTAAGGHGYGGVQRGQPTQQLARPIGAEGVEFIQKVTRPVYKTVEYQYQVDVPYQTPDGERKVRPETRTATRTVCEMVSTEIVNLADSRTRYFELDGRAVEPQAVSDRLRRPTLVLVSTDDNMVPNYYTQLFKTGTLVATRPLGYSSTPNAPAMPTAPGIQTPMQPSYGAVPASSGVYPSVGLAPDFRFASLEGKDSIRLRDFSESSRDEVTTRRLPAASGRSADSTTITLRRVTQVNDMLHYNLADVQVFMANGTPVGEAGLAALLARETTVLVSADGQRVDPFWLSNVKPTTLVVIAPNSNPVGRMPPMPAVLAPPPMIAPPLPAAAPAPALEDANTAEKPQI